MVIPPKTLMPRSADDAEVQPHVAVEASEGARVGDNQLTSPLSGVYSSREV